MQASHSNELYLAGFELAVHGIETDDIELKACASPSPHKLDLIYIDYQGHEIQNLE